uniref:Integrase core domain containing protein n=1 Tax=Solanum tuberosum TaxID=4113 RepID=M1E1E2_SOLTU
MRVQVAKLVEKPVHVPTPVMPDSLIKIFIEQPTTQSLDNIWGEIPKRKSGKRKKKVGEPDEKIRRQEKRARRASKWEAREKETCEQQQRDATLVGASGSRAPTSATETQPDHVPSSESALTDKGANASSEIDV